jgi:hypothetical protein
MPSQGMFAAAPARHLVQCSNVPGEASMQTNLYAALVVPADGFRSRIERIVAATATEAGQMVERALEPGARVLKITLVVAGYRAERS